jgi:hypothetical protein
MELPGTHWTETALGTLNIGLIFVGGAWLVAEGVRAAHRRAYNLTKVETTAGSESLQPSFTKVDHAARQAALERGDAYAAQRAAAEADPVASGKKLPVWGKLARPASQVVAATVVALVPPTANGIAEREGLSVSVTDVAQRYPIGVGLAVVVLIFSVVQLVRGGSKA